MRLSALQRFILLECFNSLPKKVDRNLLLKFYGEDSLAKENLRAKIITQSIESLIDREMLLGYGVRTPHKWFIREIAFTEKGKKLASVLNDKQLRLPLKISYRYTDS